VECNSTDKLTQPCKKIRIPNGGNPYVKKERLKLGSKKVHYLRRRVTLSLLQVHLIEKYCRCYEELVMNL